MADVVVTVGRRSVDNLAPEITIDSPADGATVTNWLTVTYTATDETLLSRIVPTVNGVEQSPVYYPDPQILVYPTGDATTVTQTLTVGGLAYDVAGNSATADPITVTLVPGTPPTPPTDTIAPVMTQTSPSDATTVTIGVSPNLAWGGVATDNDQIANVKFYRNGVQYGQPAVGGTTVTTISPSVAIVPSEWGEGTFTLTMKAVDGAANEDTSDAAVLTIVGDPDQPPSGAWISPANGATQTGWLTTSFDFTDDIDMDHVDLLVNGASVAVSYTDSPQSFQYPAGDPVSVTTTYTVSAIGFDSGNHDVQVAARTVTVVPNPAPSDTIAPVVTQTAPAAGTTVTIGTSTAWSAGATDAVGVVSMQPKRNGVAYGTAIPIAGTNVSSTVTYFPSVAGAETLSWEARDADNNVGSSGTVVLTVAPQAPPVSPSSEPLYTPPSGTALFNVYPSGTGTDELVDYATYTTFHAAFIDGDVSVAQLDQLYYCAANSGAASYIQADNYTLYGSGYVSGATLTLKTPASGGSWVRGQKLTVFRSATETPPATPTITMTDSTFSVDLFTYAPDIYVLGARLSNNTRDGDQFRLDIDYGSGTETYTETASGTNDQWIVSRLCDQAHAAGLTTGKFRIGKWNSPRAYGSMANSNFGTRIFTGQAHPQFGITPGGTENGGFVWEKERDGTYMTDYGWRHGTVFQKAVAAATEPLSVTMTLTALTPGCPTPVVCQKVRSRQVRATYSIGYNSLSDSETWLNGRLVKQVWRIGKPLNGGNNYNNLRVRMGLTIDRDGNVIRREVHFENGGVTESKTECHYDVVINGGGSAIATIPDIIHSIACRWKWPYLDQRITLQDRSVWWNSGRLPIMETQGFVYNANHLTVRLRGAGTDDPNAYPLMLTEAEIGQPGVFICDDYGHGTPGGAPSYGHMADCDAYALRAWNAQAIKWAGAFNGNAVGTLPDFPYDDTATGVFAPDGIIDSTHLTKRTWQMSSGGGRYLYWRSQSWFNSGHTGAGTFFQLQANVDWKPSHSGTLGIIPFLVTGSYWHFSVIEFHAQRMTLWGPTDVGGLGCREVGSNTTFASTGVYWRPSINNGTRNIHGQARNVGVIAAIVPYLHRRYSYWRSRAGNLNDVLTKALISHNGLGCILNDFAQQLPVSFPNKNGVAVTPPIILNADGGAGGQMWENSLVLSALGFCLGLGATEYQTAVDNYAPLIGKLVNAPISDGLSYIKGLGPAIVHAEMTLGPGRQAYTDWVTSWNEWETAPETAGERAFPPFASALSCIGNSNQNHPTAGIAATAVYWIAKKATGDPTNQAIAAAILAYMDPYFVGDANNLRRGVWYSQWAIKW